MKSKRYIVSAAGVALLLGSPGALLAKKVELKTLQDKASYTIGLDIGQNLKRQGVDVTVGAMIEGLQHGLKDVKPILSEKEIQETMLAFRKEHQAKQEKLMKEQGDANKKAGDKFLAANKSKPGVKTLPSGLQYQVLKAGKGKSPKADDVVVTHYKGTLIDGTEFDSSYSRGQPATFPVSGVIKGWTEALQLMKEGAKWKLFVPSTLAYGERGSPPKIGPNATLVFDVELVKVKDKPEDMAGKAESTKKK